MISSMGKFYRIIFLLVILMPAVGKAQTMDCEQTIAFATEEFNAGHFHSVPTVLNECLKSFYRDQRQRAFLLLTQTYLLLDDAVGARRSFLEVLSANPEFVPDEQLHAIDIVYLSKRFTATPKFSWFINAGSNISPARIIHTLNVTGQKKKYSLLPGYNFGVGGAYSYNDNIKLRLEANFFQTRYKVTASHQFGDDYGVFVDRQMWINIPLYLCYSDNIGKYRPYVYAGFSVSKLFADKASVTLGNVGLADIPIVPGNEEEADPESIFETFPATSPDFDFLKRRNGLNQSVIFGGGIKYKVGLDFVFAEVRYSAGLKNIVRPEYAIGDHSLVVPASDPDPALNEWVVDTTPLTAYRHRDDYLRLDNVSVTIGFLRPLYKPRELKRVRTKGVLRKMKRAK